MPDLSPEVITKFIERSEKSAKLAGQIGEILETLRVLGRL
jgi:hypothetical protein